MPGAVADDLDFDVTRSRVIKRSTSRSPLPNAVGGLGLAAFEGLGDLVLSRDDSHSASAASGDCLEHHGSAVAEGAEEPGGFIEVDGGLGAGQDGDIEFDGEGAGSGLVAEELEGLGRGADEGDAGVDAAS